MKLREKLKALRAKLLRLRDAIRMRFNPFLITTIYGLRDRREFVCKYGTVDNDNEYTKWIEYWDGTTLVHRSAHVTLKRIPQFIETTAGGFQQ